MVPNHNHRKQDSLAKAEITPSRGEGPCFLDEEHVFVATVHFAGTALLHVSREHYLPATII